MRKILILLLIAHSSSLAAFAQYWQQQVNYTIDVTLNDKDNTLDAFEKIEYINNSPDTLKFIWFHLWENAYKNDKTAFTDQALENGDTKFYFSDKEQKGYVNRLDFKVNNITAATEDHPQYIDIIKIVLPTPLPPGQKCIITTPFHVKLPFNFSRGGHDGQSYQATQWYPKPAVYDSKGWHPMPYLDQGEFYSEFGNFDVRITVPKNYVVAATGELQNEDEKNWLTTRKNFSWQPEKEKIKTKAGAIKIISQHFPASSKETKTLQYKQNNIHDFAWFADKRFIVNHDTCKLFSGKVIDVYTYYTIDQKKYWQQSIKYSKDAVRFYSSRVGEYPYTIVSAVQGPENFGGGMEYPTITIISPSSSDKELDITLAHEIGHNWFYGILASNERDHPWMDEGINSYYEQEYSTAKYGASDSWEKVLEQSIATIKKDQPIETTSEKFSEFNYNLVAYYKTAQWMKYLESQLGSDVFNKAMKEYFQQFQFKHLQPDDFKKVIATHSGKDVDPTFGYLSKKGILPNQQRKGSQLVLLFRRNFISQYLQSNAKNIFTLGPAVGFNSYDKEMVGGFLTNYKLPPSPFQFFVAPMYSIKTKKLVGIGTAHYSFYPEGSIRKVDLFVNGEKFTDDKFTDTAGKTLSLAFQKIVPGFRLTLKEKDPRSTLHRYIQWKTYFFGEDALHFYRDTVITGIDTTFYDKYRADRQDRFLNQLKLVIENNRALYPYSGELKIEQSTDFVKAGFTGKYFFNYPKGGGLDVRLFAGKFFYTGSKTILKQFETDRYHLNMTGANGYEDYTYSNYFIGRNIFNGAASQQIVINDGGFKVRTDLLADKVGKTDDWLAAVNFSSTVPPQINPLSLLPVKIPLKVFADIGTYAGAWKQNANADRFLYDAGFQLSLLKDVINVYVPILYSGVYRDYIKSAVQKKNRILRVISFTIDMGNYKLGKLDHNLSAIDE